MANKRLKISYEQEADVLRIEISKEPIEYAAEIGNFIVHFSPDNLPVYLEIIQAREFLLRSRRILEKAKIPELVK